VTDLLAEISVVTDRQTDRQTCRQTPGIA